jgi:hypothetical protein
MQEVINSGSRTVKGGYIHGNSSINQLNSLRWLLRTPLFAEKDNCHPKVIPARTAANKIDTGNSEETQPRY